MDWSLLEISAIVVVWTKFREHDVNSKQVNDEDKIRRTQRFCGQRVNAVDQVWWT